MHCRDQERLADDLDGVGDVVGGLGGVGLDEGIHVAFHLLSKSRGFGTEFLALRVTLAPEDSEWVLVLVEIREVEGLGDGQIEGADIRDGELAAVGTEAACLGFGLGFDLVNACFCVLECLTQCVELLESGIIIGLHNCYGLNKKRNKSICGLVEKGTSLAIEDGEELRAGQGAGVSAGGTEGAEDAGPSAVLCRSDVLQVVCTPVEHIAIDVVYLHACRPYAEPCCRHEHVAGTIAVPPHKGVTRVTELGVLWRFETGLDLPQPEARE